MVLVENTVAGGLEMLSQGDQWLNRALEPRLEAPRGGFCPILCTEPLAQSVLAQYPALGPVGISGLHFPSVSLGFP